MIHRACSLVVIAAVGGCDFGIGSDPNAVPPNACAPGHTRTDSSTACLVPRHPIAIDGDTSDWASLPSFAVGAAEVTLARNADGDADLLVRVQAALPSDAEIALALTASPARPASGGRDAITSSVSGIRYEKRGYAVVPATAQAELARTADGFEARVLHGWLTYQGAARLVIAAGSVSIGPIDVCWGFTTGVGALPASACEAQP